jgi:hypothetical protein
MTLARSSTLPKIVATLPMSNPARESPIDRPRYGLQQGVYAFMLFMATLVSATGFFETFYFFSFPRLDGDLPTSTFCFWYLTVKVKYADVDVRISI